MASGEAEAILMKAQATARGIDAVAEVITRGDAGAQNAVSLRVAERYVDAFSNLAKEGTAVVVPGNVGDIGQMIASAMAVYGKVNEGQLRLPAGQHLLAPAATAVSNTHDAGAPQGVAKNVAQTVLDGFDQTTNSRK